MSITRDELHAAAQDGEISMQFAARVRGLIGLYKEASEAAAFGHECNESYIKQEKKLKARLQRAENVISQFVYQAAPMTPEQRAAWTAWKEGSE